MYMLGVDYFKVFFFDESFVLKIRLNKGNGFCKKGYLVVEIKWYILNCNIIGKCYFKLVSCVCKIY